jgi:hypothetical protein
VTKDVGFSFGQTLFIYPINSEMKNTALILLIQFLASGLYSQGDFTNVSLDNTITEVQPMTGIVFWDDSGNNSSEAISLEYSYMAFDKVIEDSASYNWDYVESKLDDIASRNHQAIFRFRYIYPGKETTIPQYILDRDDYTELIAKSEGKDTYFADWTCEELRRFTIEFYTKFAERYDNDPRLAFVQVGFGLWAEYHIYDGPNEIGKQFPSKEFQEEFFFHLDTSFKETPWNISIDAADDYYTPFEAKPELKNIKFGLFDDSFMHSSHSGYNTTCWNFFGRERYKTSPAGGEFSYYSDYDQEHVLDYPDGPYGKPYEYYANDFHITYMIGNDQPDYQTTARIKEASMASGYKFKIVSLKTTSDSSVFEILNYGVAPIYYDAYVAVDGIRSKESLKLLAPGETKTYSVSAGAENAEITIECDRLVDGQEIQFYGTQELPEKPSINIIIEDNQSGTILLYPNSINKGDMVYLKGNEKSESIQYAVYSYLGKIELSGVFNTQLRAISTQSLNSGLYLFKIVQNNKIQTSSLIIL